MKTMKTILLLTALIFSVNSFSQSKSDKIYDNFSNKEGFTNFSFSKSMIDIVNLDLDEEGKKITGDLNEIRFLSYNPQKGEISGRSFINKAISMLPYSYDRVEWDDDEDENIEIWMLGNKRKASEFHLFIKNEESMNMQFLISFYGKFNIDDLENIKKAGINLSANN